MIKMSLLLKLVNELMILAFYSDWYLLNITTSCLKKLTFASATLMELSDRRIK